MTCSGSGIKRLESRESQEIAQERIESVRGHRKIGLADIPHVGPATPGGEWMRRYWLVVGTAGDLHEIPQAVKVLGEELVLFRDQGGQLGLLGLHCPHRGTSLEYGDIEDGGIRCAYHGWLFDVSGQCLEMPAEPKGSNFPQKLKHLSYPARDLRFLTRNDRRRAIRFFRIATQAPSERNKSNTGCEQSIMEEL